MMYGGDDVGALVLDVGSSTTKAGYAGEDCPKTVFDSVVGVGDEGKMDTSSKDEASSLKKLYVGNDFSFRRDNVEAEYPIKHGLVTDWEGVEKLWEHAFRKVLQVDPSQHPILVSEPAWNPEDQREKLVTHMFEKFNVPAMFVCKDAVLASFSMGRSTALVVNSGGGVTSAVPVHDGYALLRGVRRTKVAGDFVTELLEQKISQKVQIKPRFAIKTKGINKSNVVEQHFPKTAKSYYRHWQLDIVRDIKETRCIVAVAKDRNRREVKPEAYELPDGQTVKIGGDSHSVTEVMFRPPFNPALEQDLDPSFQFEGIHKMVADAINSTDADIRRDLYASVILCGGNTRFKGFADRLSAEILESLPPAFKLKITQPNTPVEKRFGVWIGGSILGSLGSFQQLWISKEEFQEHGANIVHRRCP